MNNEIIKILEGLSKRVKHAKWPSALEYDEINYKMKK